MAAPYDLRPLGLGEILDRIFTLYRNHFPLFAGVMAIPAALQIPTNIYAFSVLGRTLQAAARHAPAYNPDALGIIYPTLMLVIAVMATLGLGAICVAVSDVYLGGVATIRGSYRKSLRRFWSLLGLLIVLSFILVGILAVFVVVSAMVFGMLAAMGVGQRGSTAAVVLIVVLFIVLFLAIMAATIFFCMVFSLVIPALLLESTGVGGALRRSIKLTTGRRWHIFLGVLLIFLVTYAVVAIVQGPFLFATLFFVVKGGGPPLWLSLCTSVAAAGASTASSPLLMIALVLYYYDQRVRKEGFDLQHMIAEIEKPRPPVTLGDRSQLELI